MVMSGGGGSSSSSSKEARESKVIRDVSASSQFSFSDWKFCFQI